jgi:hypothetical protein
MSELIVNGAMSIQIRQNYSRKNIPATVLTDKDTVINMFEKYPVGAK